MPKESWTSNEHQLCKLESLSVSHKKSNYIGFTRVTPKHTETNNKEFIKSEFWTFLFKPFSYLVLGVVQLRKNMKNNYYR